MRQKDFVVTAELPLRADTNVTELRTTVDGLLAMVDALQISDDRGADGHMSSLAAANIVMQQGGDAVVHISCRDRNRLALQAELLGAAAMGITSLLLERGEKFPVSSEKRPKGVFEINAKQLMKLAHLIGKEHDLVSPPGWFLGSNIVAFAPDDDWQPSRISSKIEAGASFFLTQPCLQPEVVRKYMARLVGLHLPHRASVLVNVPLLQGASDVRRVNEVYAGSPVSEQAPGDLALLSDPARAGVDAFCNMVRAVRDIPGIAGINVWHQGSAESVVAALQQAGISAQD